MPEVHIDFETRAVSSPVTHGTYKYTKDPDFKILCVAFAIDDGPVRGALGLDFDGDAFVWDELKDLAADPTITFKAHNASFEYDCWHNYLVPIYGTPPIPFERWRCTAAAAAYKAMPRSLDLLGKALDIDLKKDKEGYNLMMKMCKPVTERHQHLHGKWHEQPEQLERLLEYCVRDVEAERECDSRIGDLPKDLQEEFILDMKINNRGVKLDMDLCYAILDLKEELKAELVRECESVTDGIRPSQVEKLKDWLEDRGVKLPTETDKNTGLVKRVMDGAAIKRLILEPEITEVCKHVMRLRSDYATTSLAKIDAALRYEYEGIIRNQFLFHGATTGRWSGKGVQLHNLPRGSINEDIAEEDMNTLISVIKSRDLEELKDWFPNLSPMECLKTAIRGCVMARPGSLLNVMDFSQIEARVLAWLAGQEDVLEVFRSDKDIYKYTAAQILDKEYEEVTSKERSTVGKVASLALGYQGGEGAFRKMGINLGILFSNEEAAEIKADWREKNDKIVSFWWNLERAAIEAVQTRKAYRVRGITFKVVGEWLAVKLPSGRKLWYYDPKTKMIKTKWGEKLALTYMGSDYQNNMPWGRISTYGGRWCENITQAVARDFLMSGMTNAYNEGLDVILHVHDELGAEGDKSVLQTLIAVSERLPSWGEGLPLAASGFQSEHYRK